MGYLTGLLGGFSARKAEVEAENLRQADLASQREGKVYEALMNSSDPEIQSMAITGLLESARPRTRKGGLRGWMGEMNDNPINARIRSLIGTPVESQEPTLGLPSQQFTGYVPARPPVTSPLAQPETAATEPGAPPLAAVAPAPSAMTTVGAPPPGIAAPTPAAVGQWEEKAAPVTGTRTVMKPRQVFRTPEEAAAIPYAGRYRGLRQEMELALGRPLTAEEGKQLGLELAGYSGGGAGASPYMAVEGELPDGTQVKGVFDRSRGVYIDPITREPIPGFRAKSSTASVSLGQYYEQAARALGYKSGALAPVTARPAIEAKAQELAGQQAGAVTTGKGTATEALGLNPAQRFEATKTLTDQWTKERASGREMERQFKLMQAGLARVDADPIGGSQAVLVTFQKILDPSSVVRESEYARSPEGLSIVDRLQGMIDRYGKGGAGVPKPILEEMVKTAQQFLNGVQGSSDAVRQRIQDTATSYGMDPKLVLGADYKGGAPSPSVGAPPPGSTPRATQDASGNWVIAVP